MSVIQDKLGALVWGVDPKPTRIYVSIHDHRSLYLYGKAQWQIAPSPYLLNRDQLRFEGIPVEWVPHYNGRPTTTRPEMP